VHRSFLLLAHRVPVSGAFTLNDLAGGGGRMDEVARCVSTAFTISNGCRADTELTVLFVAEPPPKSRRIRVDGSRLRYLNPDERSTAALLKNALQRSLVEVHDVEASPGMVVGAVDPPAAIAEFLRRPGCFWLTEGGRPLRDLPLDATPSGFCAILSDPTDPTESERALLEAAGVPRASVGPISLRSSQVIDVVQNEFDLRWGAGPPT
jgi:tRNA (pseudouridine54-N1)-methyltransferase